MNKLVENLILFDVDNGGKTGNVIKSAMDLCKDLQEKSKAGEELKMKAHKVIREILSVADSYGIGGNPWQSVVAAFIAERDEKFTVNCFMKNDCETLYKLFNYDFFEIERSIGENCFTELADFGFNFSDESDISDAGRCIKKLRDTLAVSEDFYETISRFYKTHAGGVIGINRAFTVDVIADESVKLKPIKRPDKVVFNDLFGYEVQKNRLIENTEAFLKGLPANNVLLYGDSGTGKSTSIRALVNEYGDEGLKLIQVYRHQMKYLNQVIEMIRDKKYKFIIYMDDLSFEDFETEYKYLKAVIEGGLEKRPENVLIYATSNRRNLIKETWNDRNDMEHDKDIHRNDSTEEKQSLAARFGVRIFYGKPNKEEFYSMVKALAKREGLDISSDRLKEEANKWEIRNGGVTGRSARQFIDYISGKEANCL